MFNFFLKVNKSQLILVSYIYIHEMLLTKQDRPTRWHLNHNILIKTSRYKTEASYQCAHTINCVYRVYHHKSCSHIFILVINSIACLVIHCYVFLENDKLVYYSFSLILNINDGVDEAVNHSGQIVLFVSKICYTKHWFWWFIIIFIYTT